MLRIIDTHAHLEEIEDLNSAIKRAKEAGVVAIIAVGSNYESNERVLEISKKQNFLDLASETSVLSKKQNFLDLASETSVLSKKQNFLDLASETSVLSKNQQFKIYTALGIHPGEIDPSRINPSLQFIEDHIHEIVGIGEIGLDWWLKDARKDTEAKKLQKNVFCSLLELAKRYKKPAIVHSRGAWKDCLTLVTNAKVEKCVFHWFSGPLNVLHGILKRGYSISASPACQYSKEHRYAIQATPLEQILLETDSPVKYKGKESEPADVVKTLCAVSELKNCTKDRLAKVTTENATKLFDLT
jgi:TatD DNase family protein